MTAVRKTLSLVKEIVGVVKWYDASKGYGFVSSPENPDVMLHATVVAASGGPLVWQGAKCTVHAIEEGGKLRCVNIMHMQSPTDETIEVMSESKRAARMDGYERIGEREGVVKFVNDVTGIGFVNTTSGDVFTHRQTFADCHCSMVPGTRVVVNVGRAPDGRLASYSVREIA